MTPAELAQAQSGDPSWLRCAIRELGTREIAGPSHNPRIIGYHQSTRLAAKTDETPWCASFMSWIMVEAGYSSTRSAAASSWADYGVPCVAVRGAIAVFRRKGGHHVGIVAGVPNVAGFVWLLGGNQGNAVSIARYKTSDLIGYRAPDPSRVRPVDAVWFGNLKPLA